MIAVLGFLALFVTYLSTAAPGASSEAAQRWTDAVLNGGPSLGTTISGVALAFGRTCLALIPMGGSAFRLNVGAALLTAATYPLWKSALESTDEWSRVPGRSAISELEDRRWRGAIAALAPLLWGLSSITWRAAGDGTAWIGLWAAALAAALARLGTATAAGHGPLRRAAASWIGVLWGLGLAAHPLWIWTAPGWMAAAGLWRKRSPGTRPPERILGGFLLGLAAGASLEIGLTSLLAENHPLATLWMDRIRQAAPQGPFADGGNAALRAMSDGIRSFSPVAWPIFLLGLLALRRTDRPGLRPLALSWAWVGPATAFITARNAELAPVSQIPLALLLFAGLESAGRARLWFRPAAAILLPIVFFINIPTGSRGDRSWDDLRADRKRWPDELTTTADAERRRRDADGLHRERPPRRPWSHRDPAVARNYASAQRELAKARARAGDDRGSAREFLGALALDPEDLESLTALGLSDLKNRNDRRSALLLKRALRRAPEADDVRGARARALARDGREEEALAEWNRILARTPDDDWALQNRADLLEALGRGREAAADWSALVRRHPDHKPLRWRLTQAWLIAGDRAAALRTIEDYSRLPLTENEKKDAEAFRVLLQPPAVDLSISSGTLSND